MGELPAQLPAQPRRPAAAGDRRRGWREVGAAWAPDTSRPPLPAQPPQIDVAYDPVGATATSGNGGFAVDGKDDWYTYSVWESSGALPQSVTVDLGQVRPDVSVLNYVPRYVAQVGPSTDGAITSYNVYVSTDGATFTMVASGDWPAERPDEDGVVRPGRRALRAPGSDRGQRHQRGGDRDRRRRARR